MKIIKKGFEKIVILMLVSIIFITMSGLSVFAAESSVPETTPTLQEMKNYLLSIGTEQKFLDDINDSMKIMSRFILDFCRKKRRYFN